MRGVGILSIGGSVTEIELPDPRPLADDEVLIAVRAAGVASWDEIVRQGGWDVGIAPPMALGVEAAGVVTAVGAAVHDRAPGDEVLTHPLPLHAGGAWAPQLIAPAGLLARQPVRPDGPQLRALTELAAAGTLVTEPGRVFPAAAAPEALAAALSGTGGQPVTLTF